MSQRPLDGSTCQSSQRTVGERSEQSRLWSSAGVTSLRSRWTQNWRCKMSLHQVHAQVCHACRHFLIHMTILEFHRGDVVDQRIDKQWKKQTNHVSVLPLWHHPSVPKSSRGPLQRNKLAYVLLCLARSAAAICGTCGGYFDWKHGVNDVVLRFIFNSFPLWNSRMVTWVRKCHRSGWASYLFNNFWKMCLMNEVKRALWKRFKVFLGLKFQLYHNV